MKKRINITETNKKISKKLVNNRFIEWIIYMIGYAIVLITVSVLFSSFEINNQYFGLYALLASIIIYILNQTIKPVLTFITLPITVLSWGLLYPISNVIILYITSFILGKNNFNISGIFAPFFIAIVISLLNILMEGLVLKPMTKRRKK
jgi:putative membrane protein